MNKLLLAAAVAASATGCVATKDLSKTLRYADNRPVGVQNIKFVELQRMKRGQTCTFNLLYFLPIYGDGSIITAAEDGKINTVQLIGETGKWYFPFNTNCTVVYGDKPEGAPPAVPHLDAGS